jgi:hypothetical protein
VVLGLVSSPAVVAFAYEAVASSYYYYEVGVGHVD